MKGYSAFANKVWNAARFVLMNIRDDVSYVSAQEIDALLKDGNEELQLEDVWILDRLNRVASEVSEALDKYRFHEASALIYKFIWHELCDWYIELVKPILTGAKAPVEARRVRSKVLIHVLDNALRILHPFMPFITEEIWQRIPHEGESIMVQPFPVGRQIRENARATENMQDLMELVGAMRAVRADMNIDPKKMLEAVLVVSVDSDQALVEDNVAKICSLVRLKKIRFLDALPEKMLRGVWRLGEFALDIAGAVDVCAERERLGKEAGRIHEQMEKIAAKLRSDAFLSRAPEDIVAENRLRYQELEERYHKIAANLSRLPAE